jgi:chaperonin GroES
MESFRPVRDIVLVKLETPPEKTDGGIWRPKTVQDKEAKFATVVAVGPGRLSDHGVLIPVAVKPGERVVISEYNLLNRVTRPGEGHDDLFTCADRDIYGVIEPA